jgi:hypothetical protein
MFGINFCNSRKFTVREDKFVFDIGRKIGISRVSINKIETEKTIPTLKIANDIANVLGVCMYQVFYLNGKETYRYSDCNSGRPL